MTNYFKVPGHVIYVPAHIYGKHASISQLRIRSSQNLHLEMYLALMHVASVLEEPDRKSSQLWIQHAEKKGSKVEHEDPPEVHMSMLETSM